MLKEKQSISKLGYTIYNPDELKLIYKKYSQMLFSYLLIYLIEDLMKQDG